MALYLEEFLYRGRPPESDQAPAWHVILGDYTKDAFGRPSLALSGALTPDQAAAAGFPLPKVLAGINAGTMGEAAVLTARLAEAEARAAALEVDRAAREAEATAARAELAAERARLAALQSDLNAAQEAEAAARVRADLEMRRAGAQAAASGAPA